MKRKNLSVWCSLVLCLTITVSCKKNSDAIKLQTQDLSGDLAKVCAVPVPGDSSENPSGGRTTGVWTKAYPWENGQTIRIKFLNGTAFQQNKVKYYAPQWLLYANLRFQWVSLSESAEIRIEFTDNISSSSSVGKTLSSDSQTWSTMDFGRFTVYTPEAEFSRIIMHEFGHALGLEHEHLHPYHNIPWIKENVYAHYLAVGSTKAAADWNVFTTKSATSVTTTNYDVNSVMHYYIPANWTSWNRAFGESTYLSNGDREIISNVYPYPDRRYYLSSGQKLLQSDYIQSPNGRFKLNMQGDGNLVLYKDGTIPVWYTGTHGNPQANRLNMQGDGNLVLHDANNKVYWYSNTHNNPGAFLLLTNNSLGIYKLGWGIQLVKKIATF